jgi:uncharacterized protein (DUF58 family)
VQVHPTRSAVHLSVAGSLAAVMGVALGSGPVVAWGGAMLVGLAIARAVTCLSVARIRTAGFEMLWRSPQRVRRMGRGEVLEIEAELRNRDARAARFVELRAVASPDLELQVSPEHGEVPAGGRLQVSVRVSGRRVGHHAVHGLSLELQGGPGLFEVPLTFANPFGIEVLPRAYTRLGRSSRGGRSRREAEQSRTRPLAGESPELRELRQHHAGDPFRRIAWKASARRGELLVREYEREERDVVFLLLDASIELSAGHAGEAAFDRALDEAAAVLVRHIARGDDVGLGVVGRRVLAWLSPERGSSHALRMLETLAHAASPVHADRSALDESEVALRVLEHMRPLDPDVAGNVGPYELDRLARRADKLRPKAPFANVEVFASSPRERALRNYLEAFGLGSSIRTGPDRLEVDELLVQSLTRARRERPEPTLIYLWSPPPELGSRARLVEAVARRRGRHAQVLWACLPVQSGIDQPAGEAGVAGRTLTRRARLAAIQGERALRRLGVQVERVAADSDVRSPTRGR